jgi:glutathione S-transferase
MLVLHHLNNSRSQRVLWLLEELGLEYEIVRYERDPKTMAAPASLRAIHPLGKSPVLVDNGLVLAESAAILEHLVETHGGGTLIPAAGTPERMRYRYWMHYAEGSLMPLLLLTLVFNRLPNALPRILRPVGRAIGKGFQEGRLIPQTTIHLNFLEQELAHSAWFAGDTITAADIQMIFPIDAARARGGLDESRPNLWNWLKRCEARPAYQRALERGGPYQLMK